MHHDFVKPSSLHLRVEIDSGQTSLLCNCGAMGIIEEIRRIPFQDMRILFDMHLDGSLSPGAGSALLFDIFE